MTKALIVYGTRYGSSAKTSQVIAEELKEQGFETKIVDAKKDKGQNIIDFDLIIIGSGIQMGKWTAEPQDFIKKHQKELAAKKVALFVSCGAATPLSEGEQRTKELEEGKQKYLQNKAAEFNLKPIAFGYFGGCYDFNKMSWFFKKTLSAIKPQLESSGHKETEPGLYDLRDLDEIRKWTKELART